MGIHSNVNRTAPGEAHVFALITLPDTPRRHHLQDIQLDDVPMLNSDQNRGGERNNFIMGREVRPVKQITCRVSMAHVRRNV